MKNNNQLIAVLLPCFNEAIAIGSVIDSFKSVIPDAKIYVYDNNSTDKTCEVARKHGAIVRNVSQQGKGNVVRRMFADIEADIYIMADGDDTYDANSVQKLIDKLVLEELDMVVGSRETNEVEAYRAGHVMGNKLLTGFVDMLFGSAFTDILSGYRVFSRRFIKSFPALSEGFEIETELTIHALELRMPVGEVATSYKSRPEGSVSKLSTYKDGFRILSTITRLFRFEKPMQFFLLGFSFLFILSLVSGIPVISEFMQTGLVTRLPTAVLAASLSVLAFLSLVCGLILDTVTKGRQESKRLAYLSIPLIRK